jgi:FKBP-type peptidyl-prolyl cis-trans isomerase/linker histone H1 and H5 family
MPKGKAETTKKPAALKAAAASAGKKTAAVGANNTKPKSVLYKIVYAIRNTPQQGANGVSRVSIAKYIKAEFDYDNASALKLALKKGVSSNVLEQVGQSFRVKGDAIIEPIEKAEDKLVIEDLVAVPGKDDEEESSRSAQHGDTVNVKYVGTLDNGVQFDAANSFSFLLGAGDVIKGWDKGIVGMRVGGKRKLVVPSKLGYGKRGCSPDIPPNATLHFIVTLKKICRPSE